MIRVATEKDVLNIYNLEMLNFNKPYSMDTIKSDLNNDKVKIFVYEKGDNLIGYISIYYFIDEANLQKIVVAESERRKGVASELIDYTINFLRQNKINKYYLEVNEHNLIAIKVYEKLGFKKVGTRKNYYGSDSAIIFEMLL